MGSPFGLTVINPLNKFRGGAWCFWQIKISKSNKPDALTAQGDEERQLGIPVSPMCELGTPEFLAATTVGCITAVGV